MQVFDTHLDQLMRDGHCYRKKIGTRPKNGLGPVLLPIPSDTKPASSTLPWMQLYEAAQAERTDNGPAIRSKQRDLFIAQYDETFRLERNTDRLQAIRRAMHGGAAEMQALGPRTAFMVAPPGAMAPTPSFQRTLHRRQRYSRERSSTPALVTTQGPQMTTSRNRKGEGAHLWNV